MLSFPVGQVGSPVHAKAASGATADVTLDSASWQGFPLIELTITGTSAQPFKYDETYIVAGVGGGDQPFTHPNDTHWLGGAEGRYTINGKPPLGSGSVTTEQTAHGIIRYSWSSQGDKYIKMIDPDTENPFAQPFGVVEAGWKVHT